jgi:uncharacterized membrane protein
LQLAQYIKESTINSAVEWEFKYKTEYVKASSWFLSGLNTQQVMDGIGERSGYYDSAVEIKIRSGGKLLPVCAMVFAIVPATFGLYLLYYSCSTKLGRGQGEYWDDSTFFVRMLQAVPMDDEGTLQIMEKLKDMYAQLISFFSESCEARRVYLRSIGASGEALI